MRQIRITTADLLPAEDNDCYLAPDDPIHELKKASMMGGLGSAEALAKYNNASLPTIVGNNNAQIMREQNIKPGTEEWFKLWFSNPIGNNDENSRNY